MICYVPAESNPGELRAALTPTTTKALTDLGLQVQADPGVGTASRYADEDYTAAGANLVSDPAAALAAADLVLRVRKPSPEQIAALKPGAIHLSFLDPFNESELLQNFAAAKASAVSFGNDPSHHLGPKKWMP